MSEKREVIVLHETVAQGWARDASTFALFLGLIGIGVAVDSSAMQWVGAIIGFTIIASRVANTFKNTRMTIAEARKRLDELERAPEIKENDDER